MSCRGFRVPLLVLAAGLAGACDFVVEDGEVLELDDGLVARGPAGDPQTSPRPAVEVRPGGTLIVRDTDVRGGDFLGSLEFAPATMPSSELAAGAGVRVDGGFVFMNLGRVEGGAVAIAGGDDLDPNSPFVPPFGASVPLAGAGIQARNAVVSIARGGVFGGRGARPGGSGPAGPSGSFPRPLGRPGPALSIDQSTLMISGGGFVGGRDAVEGPAFLAASAEVTRSNVSIRGGTFFQTVLVNDSQVFVLGGTFASLRVGALPAPAGAEDLAGCVEVRGGDFATSITVLGNETVMLFGTEFNKPLGRLQFPEITGNLGGRVLVGTQVSGTFVDGTPFAALTLLTDGQGVVILADPQDAGCPKVL